MSADAREAQLDASESVNGLTALRRSNLITILDLVHSVGELSRAELTTATGLSRFTVRNLVAELIGRGYLAEASPILNGKAGHPTRKVRLGDDHLAVACVEIRPDYTRVGMATLGGRLLASVTRQTSDSRNWETVLDDAADLIGEGMQSFFASGRQLVHVAIGAQAFLDKPGGRVVSSAFLGWSDVPLVDELRRRCSFVDTGYSLNRVMDLAIRAERLVSPEPRDTGLLLVFSDTGMGLGGAYMEGGQTLEGDFNSGMHLGHIIVDPGGRSCFCGRHGCLEQYVGIVPLARDLGVVADEAIPSSAVGEAILSRLSDGDGAVRQAVLAQARWLGQGLDVSANLLGPREVVLGGALVPMAPIMMDTLRRHMVNQQHFRKGPPIVIRASDLTRDSIQQGGMLVAIDQAILEPWMFDASGEFARS